MAVVVVVVVVVGGGGPDPQFARWSLMMDAHLQFKQMVVWDKGPMGMGWHYRRSYETILVAQKRGGKCRWFDTSKKIENVIRHIKKIIPSAAQHPTAKPSALAGHFIELHSRPGDIVLDPFCGAGSTLVAARDKGRRAIGIEIDPAFVSMAEVALRGGGTRIFAKRAQLALNARKPQRATKHQPGAQDAP